MMKILDEVWEEYGDGTFRHSDGRFWELTSERQRLASAAPELAKMLKSCYFQSANIDWHNCRDILIKAGVIVIEQRETQ